VDGRLEGGCTVNKVFSLLVVTAASPSAKFSSDLECLNKLLIVGLGGILAP